MNRKKLAAVSYLNTKPLIYGISNHPLYKNIDLTLAIPSKCADLLASGEVDIALMPVGALTDLAEYQIISDYCIGTDGEVRTVCIYSEVPIQEIETIILDSHSRTSVLLCKILMDKLWQNDVQYKHGFEGFEDYLSGTTAGLVIGDKAFKAEQKYAYKYDLGKGWKDLTGLPFVFATWVTTRQTDDDFLKAFNQAQNWGVNHLSDLLDILQPGYPGIDLRRYYHENIKFDLDDLKITALDHFLKQSYTVTDSIIL